MSSFRNAAKSYQKVHRERPQLEARKHLGQLEKKKDYRRRATEHHAKQNKLKELRNKALDKNPDEFYFNMVRAKLVDGEHILDEKAPVYTKEQLMLMESQDIRYIQFKRSVELKKIERLKANLQLLDGGKPKNQHIIYMDTYEEANNFDPAKYFDTHPSLVNRAFNRPTLKMLKEQKKITLNDHNLAEMTKEKKDSYTELVKRIEREKQLKIIEQKMTVKKILLNKKVKKKKVADETVNSAAVYRFDFKRKR